MTATGLAYAFWGDEIKQRFERGITPLPTSTPPPIPTQTPPSTPTSPPRRAVSPVTELLAEAQTYIDASQFTMPAGSNALEKYQQILEIDPTNAEARQGLASMLQSYAALVIRILDLIFFRIEMAGMKYCRQADFCQALYRKAWEISIQVVVRQVDTIRSH